MAMYLVEMHCRASTVSGMVSVSSVKFVVLQARRTQVKRRMQQKTGAPMGTHGHPNPLTYPDGHGFSHPQVKPNQRKAKAKAERGGASCEFQCPNQQDISIRSGLLALAWRF